MRKPSNITDFFKPYAQSSHKKRTLPPDNPLETGAIRHATGVKPQTRDHGDEPSEKNVAMSDESLRDLAADVHSDEIDTPPAQLSGATDGSRKDDVFSCMNHCEPLSSQRTVPTSRQRIIKNGRVLIRSSEDDASDSDSSLEDINALLAPKECRGISPPRLEVAAPVPNTDHNDGPQSSKRRREYGRKTILDDTARLPSHPIIPKYKFSLDSLVKQSQIFGESETQAAKARLLLRSLEQQGMIPKEGETRISNGTTNTNEDLIATVMKQNGEENDVGRLLDAMKRTEALYSEKSWSFLVEEEDTPESEGPRFPQIDRLTNVLEGTHSRQQAFLSGYMGQLAEKRSLPEEVLKWLMDEVSIETRDDLVQSYTYTLKKAAQRLTPLLTPDRCDTLFRNAGASIEALSKHKPIVPRLVIPPQKKAERHFRLLSVIHMLRDLANFFNGESRTHVIHLLCRMLFDKSIISQSHFMMAIEESLTSLVNTIPEADLGKELHTICQTIHPCTEITALRLQLLQNMPPSKRFFTIQRRLSLAFFFSNTEYLNKHPEDLLDLGRVAAHLQRPEFTISNDTDYAELAASMAILSIGVGLGDPPTPGCDASQEALFNTDMDVLSERIKAIFTQIIDSGASHRRRTEAKQTLEAFHSRLLYSVRTKRKPKTMLIGDASTEVGPDSRQGAMLRGFLDRAKQHEDIIVLE